MISHSDSDLCCCKVHRPVLRGCDQSRHT